MPLSTYQPTDEREDDTCSRGGQQDEVDGEGGQQDVQVYMSVTNVVLGYHLLGLNTLHFCGNAYSNCQLTNEDCSLPYAASYSLGTAVPLTPPPSR